MHVCSCRVVRPAACVLAVSPCSMSVPICCCRIELAQSPWPCLSHCRCAGSCSCSRWMMHSHCCSGDSPLLPNRGSLGRAVSMMQPTAQCHCRSRAGAAEFCGGCFAFIPGVVSDAILHLAGTTNGGAGGLRAAVRRNSGAHVSVLCLALHSNAPHVRSHPPRHLPSQPLSQKPQFASKRTWIRRQLFCRHSQPAWQPTRMHCNQVRSRDLWGCWSSSDVSRCC